MEYTHKQLIALIKTRTGKPVMVRELMRLLKLTTDDRHELKRALNELVLSGEIIKTRGNRYGLPEKMSLTVGKLSVHQNRYGLVLPDKVTVFRGPILGFCATEAGVRTMVRHTVVQELAHHFGISDDRLHELGRD